jgi:hypothetical protein
MTTSHSAVSDPHQMIRSGIHVLGRFGCCTAGTPGGTHSGDGVFVVLFVVALLIVGLIAIAFAGFQAPRGSDGGDDGTSGPGWRGPEWPSPQDPGPRGGNPEWWPEFERQFAAYVHDVRVRRVTHPVSRVPEAAGP